MTFSPPTAVNAPAPSTMKRNANATWRCARAISPGKINCNPEKTVSTVNGAPSAGFESMNTRRSASAVPTSSPARRSSGRISS
jgi:hypothetical protein